MPVGLLLSRARYTAQALMRDTITITRVTGQTYDPVTLQYTPTVSTLYTGKADVRPVDVQSREIQAGERAVALRTFDVRLPYATTAAFAQGDLVNVTASEDATLVGRTLTVTSVARGGRKLRRHLDAEDKS